MKQVELDNTEQTEGTMTPPEQEKAVKQGRSCCGCLCDMRRAIIILSVLGTFFQVLAIVFNKLFTFDFALDDIEDEDDRRRIEDLFSLHIGMTCLAIAGFIMAIIGGIKFKRRPVIMNMMIMVATFLVNAITFLNAANDIDEFDYGPVNMIGSIIGVVMSLYVHISFLRKMRMGIMTPENYPREEQSCCCV